MAHFTRQEIEEIRQRILTESRKDTQFPDTDRISTSDYVAIVQNGINKKVTVGLLYKELTFEEYTIRIYVLEGSTMLVNHGSANLIALVFRNEEDITDRVPESYFSWERTSRDTESDMAWNNHHVGIGNRIRITGDDVNKSCTFFCCVPTDFLKTITNNN